MTEEQMERELKDLQLQIDKSNELVERHQLALVGSEDGSKKGLAHQTILLMETIQAHATRITSLEVSRIQYESSFKAIKATTALFWLLIGAAASSLIWLWTTFGAHAKP